MDALAHRQFGQTDENDLAHAGREIDFDLDGQGIDAEQRVRMQLREHGDYVLWSGFVLQQHAGPRFENRSV